MIMLSPITVDGSGNVYDTGEAFFQVNHGSDYATLKYNSSGIRAWDKAQAAGNYEVTWDAANYPSGVYYYGLIAGGFTETRKNGAGEMTQILT